MEGNSEDSSLDSSGNHKAFEAVKKRKLESVPYPDDANGFVENFAKQSATEKQTNVNISKSECESNYVGSEVSPQEFVFSIDHVLEQILSSLDLATLFHCRLVSHTWRIASTEMILKSVGTKITFKFSSTDKVYYVSQSTAEDEDAAHKSTLEDLIRFLENNYSQTSPFKMSEFPCEVFEFVDGSLSNPKLQSFLTTFGDYISTLVLDFWNSLEGESKATLVKQIGHLLNIQAPHLRDLQLDSCSLEIIEDEDNYHPVVSSTDTGLSPPIQDGQESKEIKRLGQSGLRKLKYLDCQREILDYIISISPNLQEISLYGQDYHLLSLPLNRLHFLKEFQYSIGDDEIFNYENFKLIEAALFVSNEEREIQKLPPIKFTELSVDFANIVDPMLENPNIQSSFVRVIGKILELSLDTLESIFLVYLVQDTLIGLKWPRVLPNVSKLELCLSTVNGSGLELLPWSGNFKIQETFPKLKRLTFDEVIDYDGNVPISSPGEFLRNCEFGPAPNVEFVEVAVDLFLHDHDEDVHDVDVAEDAKRFRSDVRNSVVRLFPSAELIINGKVYK